MKFPLTNLTFPTLELSTEEKRAIEVDAEAVVKKTIEQYYEHLTTDSGVVNEKRWKKIKQGEDVHVYRERSSAESQSEEEPKVPLSSLLVFGSIKGTLDDVMYGVLNPSVEEMQLKSAYVEDGFVDWRLLASIIKPSEKDPFRELSLKWNAKCHPHFVGALMRARDNVFIESSGIALTPNGERIGYHIKNSVDVPQIRNLDEFGVVRVKLTAFEFFRQRKENCVEVYSRSVLIPNGDAPALLAATTSAVVAVAVFKHVHYAEMKKLTRIVRSREQQSQSLRTNSIATDASSLTSSSASSSESAPTSSSSSPSSTSIPSRSCTLCNGSGLSFTSSKKKHCRICCLRVCSRCRVTKTLFVPIEQEKQLSSVDMTFCTRCMVSASCASSAKFAVLDVLSAEDKLVDYAEALR